MRLGDVFADFVAQPIARGIDYALGTDIQNCPGCKQRQEWLNNLGEDIYDLFWSNNKGENMPDEQVKSIEYLLQVSVVATDLVDAINKYKTDGKVITGAPRPQIQTGTARMTPSSLSPTQGQVITRVQGNAQSQSGG